VQSIAKFPLDLIEPVAKGGAGGDIVHTVNWQIGSPAGAILWDLKNTKHWSDGWLAKLRDNKRAAKADVALRSAGSILLRRLNCLRSNMHWRALAEHPSAAPLALTKCRTVRN